MILTHCQDQKLRTLDEFYAMIAGLDEAYNQRSGRAMLALLARLRALPDERRVWGLTSHSRLCLLAQDVHTAPWFVIVSAHSPQHYAIDYLMPERLAPWPKARVQGEAESEDEAVEMILIAMEKSEGWG